MCVKITENYVCSSEPTVPREEQRKMGNDTYSSAQTNKVSRRPAILSIFRFSPYEYDDRKYPPSPSAMLMHMESNIFPASNVLSPCLPHPPALPSLPPTTVPPNPRIHNRKPGIILVSRSKQVSPNLPSVSIKTKINEQINEHTNHLCCSRM